MNKRFFIAWAVVFVAWMIGDFVVHGTLLYADHAKLPNLFRPETESQQYFLLMILAHVIMAGAFVWIYSRGAEAKPWLGKLHVDMVTALNSPDVRQRLQELGLDVAPQTPEQFAAFIK